MGESAGRGDDATPRRSASAEAAALRWQERQPDDLDAATGGRLEPEPGEEEPRDARRSASAEAAALRWKEQHSDDD